MPFDRFIDMELDDEDKLDLGVCCGPTPDSKERLIPQYPWGLRINLTKHEIEKLGLDTSDVASGDYLHIKAFAKVTSVSLNDQVNSNTGEKVQDIRVELQIEKLAIEDEDDE